MLRAKTKDMIYTSNVHIIGIAKEKKQIKILQIDDNLILSQRQNHIIDISFLLKVLYSYLLEFPAT